MTTMEDWLRDHFPDMFLTRRTGRAEQKIRCPMGRLCKAHYTDPPAMINVRDGRWRHRRCGARGNAYTLRNMARERGRDIPDPPRPPKLETGNQEDRK